MQSDLNLARKYKNDEFYTQFDDIQRELDCYYHYDRNFLRDKVVLLPCDDPGKSKFTEFFAKNFECYGLKKLMSTSYSDKRPDSRGKILTMTAQTMYLHWEYLKGNGDFRSEEVTKLRDESDVIITNPPFSLFRDFLKWIVDANKQFLIIGNINCITYKEVFPLIKENKIWLGNGMGRWISSFIVPEDYELYGTETRIDKYGNRTIATNQCLWLTNLKHGKRYQTLRLMTMDDNLKHSKHKIIREQGYPKYDNYDAIEVPYTDAIPNDYNGVMGVPITFLNKYCPAQFEILGIANRGAGDPSLRTKVYTKADYPNYSDLNAGPVLIRDGVPKSIYPRILIMRRTN